MRKLTLKQKVVDHWSHSNACGELIRQEDWSTTDIHRKTRGLCLYIIYSWRSQTTSAESFLKFWLEVSQYLAKSHLKTSRSNWTRNVWDPDFMIKRPKWEALLLVDSRALSCNLGCFLGQVINSFQNLQSHTSVNLPPSSTHFSQDASWKQKSQFGSTLWDSSPNTIPGIIWMLNKYLFE